MSVYKHQGKYRWEYVRKNKRYSKSGFATRKEAEEAEIKSKAKEENLNLNLKMLCKGRLKELETYRTAKYKKENEKLINNLIEIWGFKSEITKQDVEEFLETIKSNYVHNKYLRFIKALFNYGIDKGWFTYNPAARIKFRPITRNSKYIPSKEDIQKVLKVVNEEQRMYLLTIINTMGRVGEINNLRAEDVYEDYLILKTRKSKNSDLVSRKIPFNKTLREIFKRKEVRQGYVFTYRGEQIKYRSKFLKRACKKAGVKVFTYHCLRHYGASVLANAGVALTDLQTLLGHQRPSTTDIYLQAIKNSVKDAVKNLEDL